jgi:ElaB/YqjD/DUF883 family membrane-anchored ribosome-binding protein
MDQQRFAGGNNQRDTGEDDTQRGTSQGIPSGTSTAESAAGYPRDMTDAFETGQSDTMAKVGRTAQATWSQAKQEVAKRMGEAEDLTAQASEAVNSYAQQMLGYGRQACEATETYMRENPWRAFGIGVSLGLLMGVLISRR